MKILIATPEADPYVKTGGLADVCGSLLRELRRRGTGASLVLPLYECIREVCRPISTGASFTLTLGARRLTGKILASDRSASPEAYFIQCDELYGRRELYGTAAGDFPDNALRFSFFSRAVLELCRSLDIRPDVIHCNDWQTGLVPLYLRSIYAGTPQLRSSSVVFTIHNLGYQGIFPASDLDFLGVGREYFHPEGIEFYGKINFMKAGLAYADLLVTVSDTYSREILTPAFGFGLDGVLRKRQADLYGVLNGIDYGVWDPSADDYIPVRYRPDDLAGKSACKKALLNLTGLTDPERPLFGMVGRLSEQKGLDLVSAALDRMVGSGANVVILGKGDAFYQNLMREAGARLRSRVHVRIGFDEALAHLFNAGCDFLLMPSRYEPCGLGQLIALRYGTLPVARRTGGLADTIVDFATASDRATGFLFTEYAADAFFGAVQQALEVFRDRAEHGRMIARAMRADFSWQRPADRYDELYRRAVDGRAAA